MFKAYAHSMMNGRGFQPMMSADTGGGGGTTQTDPPATDPPATDPPADDPPSDDPVTFDERQQAEIDRIINQKIAKERKKAAKEQQEAIDREKMTADEKAENDRIIADKKASEREAKANERMVNLELKDVARELGVPSKKLERLLKVVDRDDIEIDEDGNVKKSDVESAVKALLVDFPEFKGSESSKGPGDGYNGGSDTKAKYTLAQIQSMDTSEISKNWDDVQKSMAIHNKK